MGNRPDLESSVVLVYLNTWLARLCENQSQPRDLTAALSKLNILGLFLFLLWLQCTFTTVHFTARYLQLTSLYWRQKWPSHSSLWYQFSHKTFLAAWESLLFAGWCFSDCRQLDYATILDWNYRQNSTPTDSLGHPKPNFLKRKNILFWMSALASDNVTSKRSSCTWNSWINRWYKNT